MRERKQRHSQNTFLLREIIQRLREYEPEEVVTICNKYRKRRRMPPLAEDVVEKLFEKR